MCSSLSAPGLGSAGLLSNLPKIGNFNEILNNKPEHPFSALSLIAALFIPFNLQAEEAGAFLGFTIGQMDFADDRVLAWKFLGGYHFNEHFSAELAYVDSRKAKEPIKIAGAPFMFSLDLSGFTFAGVYRYPVTSQFNIFAKGGGFIWSAEGELTSGISGRTLSNKEFDGTSYFVGAGAEFEVIKKLSLRAEWERLNMDVDDASGGFNFLSLGLLYKF